jgi:hypothetical protein
MHREKEEKADFENEKATVTPMYSHASMLTPWSTSLGSQPQRTVINTQIQYHIPQGISRHSDYIFDSPPSHLLIHKGQKRKANTHPSGKIPC